MSVIDEYVGEMRERIYNIKDPEKLLEFINNNLPTSEKAKKERGEVFTPVKIINDMLDTLPEEVWKNPELKWLDPASGLGNFSVVIYKRLLDGLKYIDFKKFPKYKSKLDTEEKRRKHILENMLYMVEFDKGNVFFMKKILCGNKYNLNIFQGSFISHKSYDKSIKVFNGKFDNKKEVKFFDIIVGNPPYQIKFKGNKKSQAIWNNFVKISFLFLKKNIGYLLLIHPSIWRDIKGDFKDIFDLIMSKNLIYLSMNDFDVGREIFNSGTNFDYYLLKNNITYNNITKIKDIDNIKYSINLNNWDFIPSGAFSLFNKLIAKNKENKVDIIYDRTLYGTDKKNMKNINNKEFKYPCCYSITQKDGLKLFYSNIKKDHFGIPKIMFSNGLGTYPIIDKTGKYGLTQYCYGIKDNLQNLELIKIALNSQKLINLMKYVKFSNNKYNYKIFSLFKKDFYKHII